MGEQEFVMFAPAGEAPPARRRGMGCWWTGCLGGSALMMLLCCGGVGGVAYFGISLLNKEIEVLLAKNPVVREHLGQLESVEVDWKRTMIEDDDDTFVFQLKGDKGKAVAVVESVTNSDGDEEIRGGRLELSDGTEVPLIEEAPSEDQDVAERSDDSEGVLLDEPLSHEPLSEDP